jgi:glycosyltransferase involved in cell wall biosynthesis
MMLLKLVREQCNGPFVPAVATLADGSIRKDLEAMGVPVHVLPLRAFRQPSALAALVGSLRPALIHSWLYRADLVSGLALFRHTDVKLIWGVRASNTLSPDLPLKTRALVHLNSLLSHVMPDRIIACGEEPRRVHEGYGYARKKMRVVPNGFELRMFRPCANAREEIRHSLGIPAEAPVISMLARLHPMKDYPGLLRAIEELDNPRVHFVLAGSGVVSSEPLFVEALSKSRHRDRVHLLGARNDPPRLWAAADVGTLSSSSEGFPNAIGEAMCCEVPCVATDVGETGVLIADTGRIVAPRDPVALARGWQELLAVTPEERRALGRRARQRMATVYSIESVAKQFEQIYDDTLANAR